MKKLILGNEAVARGLYEAGCSVVSSYPGTPSTEITEKVSTYDGIYSEWAPNEKVAVEVSIGASIGGARSFCAMKHVGLNVAADPLFTVAYTGVNAGLVIAVADDPGMHSSQNEQDSRHYAIAAKVPMLEPSDSQECLDFVKKAYEISEKYDTPVLLRLSTRISHSRSIVQFSQREQPTLKEYKKDIKKYVMMPQFARGRHVVVEERMKALGEYSESCELNKIEMGGRIGVIASGIAYDYAREALGDKASYLKLGLVNPLPVKLIKEFAKSVDELYVIEELDDIIETHCKKNGIDVKGKELFSYLGEYTASDIAEKILGEKKEIYKFDEEIPVRPPVLCPGCPHRGIFYVLNKLKLVVSGDIGCYTLGAQAPLSAIDTTICMGASISALHGMNKARGGELAGKSVAVIGDSTFMHSGMTGLANIAYNKGISTVIILDNRITGMTGHQQNPCTGLTIKGEDTVATNLPLLCKALGINRVAEVDPFDLKEVEAIIREELKVDEPSVIIAKRPCALLKSVKPKPSLNVNKDKCTKCKMCMKIGCPAITIEENSAKIDATLCVGCDLCKKVCHFGAIGSVAEEGSNND